MTARVVTIDGVNWVAGLAWRSFNDNPSKGELREHAAQLEIESPWVALRIGEEAIQGGYCAPLPDMKKPTKLKSLAAMVADSKKEPWLGIYQIGEGIFWYIAVRNNHAILLDGDVIGNETEIYDARERHIGYDDWNYVEGDLDDLKEMLALAAADAKPTPLKSLTGGDYGPALKVAAVVAVVGAIGGGAYGWQVKQRNDARAYQASIAKMKAELAASTPPPVAAPTVPAYPAPGDWLRACNQVLSPLPLSDRGWVIDKVGCDSTSAVVSRLLTDGATVANRPEGEVSEQGDSIQQRIALSGVKPSNGSDTIELAEAKLTARAWAQAGGHKLTLAVPAQPQALPGAPVSPQTAQPTQVVAVIDMNVSPFREETLNGLASIPGLRITTMNTTESGWHLEGIIYGR